MNIGNRHARLWSEPGVVIEASMLARLFGIRMLTLEGTIVVSAAQPRAAHVGTQLGRAARLLQASSHTLAQLDDR